MKCLRGCSFYPVLKTQNYRKMFYLSRQGSEYDPCLPILNLINVIVALKNYLFFTFIFSLKHF